MISDRLNFGATGLVYVNTPFLLGVENAAYYTSTFDDFHFLVLTVSIHWETFSERKDTVVFTVFTVVDLLLPSTG